MHDAQFVWDIRVPAVIGGVASQHEAFYRCSRFRNLHPVDAKGIHGASRDAHACSACDPEHQRDQLDRLSRLHGCQCAPIGAALSHICCTLFVGDRKKRV